VRIEMPVEVHADEAVELQKARIDFAHHARMRERHLGDDVAAEPVDAAVLGQLVDGGRVARVSIGPPIRSSNAAHTGSRSASIRATAASTGTDGWHTRQMTIAAERMQDRDDVVDVVVEIEAAFGERHHARVHPVGDVDVMVRQERFDGAAQQRRNAPTSARRSAPS
jgi:hypothetical protein